MCRIRPFVDLAAGTLTVSAPGMPDLVLPLNYLGQEHESGAMREGKPHGLRSTYINGVGINGAGECRSVEGGGGDNPVTVRVCGNRRAGVTCVASASAWFTRFLGVRCSLVRAAAIAGAGDWSNVGSNTGSGELLADDVPAVKFGAGDGDGDGAMPYPLSGGRNGVGSGRVPRTLPWLRAGLGDGLKSTPCSVPATGAVSTAEHDGGAHAAGCRAFANEAPYLLISRASVAKANDMIRRESGTVGGGKEALNGDVESGEDHEQVCVCVCVCVCFRR